MEIKKVKPRLKVEVHPRHDGRPVVPSDLEDLIEFNDWSADPGTGRSILLPDGREVPNPVPHDPPLGFSQQDTVMEMVQRQVKAHLQLLHDQDVIDSLEDLDDFGEDEDGVPYSPYEIVLKDEFPGVPAAAPADSPTEGDAPAPSEPAK